MLTITSEHGLFVAHTPWHLCIWEGDPMFIYYCSEVSNSLVHYVDYVFYIIWIYDICMIRIIDIFALYIYLCMQWNHYLTWFENQLMISSFHRYFIQYCVMLNNKLNILLTNFKSAISFLHYVIFHFNLMIWFQKYVAVGTSQWNTVLTVW